jgi:hypothetical protein
MHIRFIIYKLILDGGKPYSLTRQKQKKNVQEGSVQDSSYCEFKECIRVTIYYVYNSRGMFMRVLKILNIVDMEFNNKIDNRTYRKCSQDSVVNGPLLVPQLKRRNYNSLIESLTPSIAHE